MTWSAITEEKNSFICQVFQLIVGNETKIMRKDWKTFKAFIPMQNVKQSKYMYCAVRTEIAESFFLIFLFNMVEWWFLSPSL